MQPHQRFAGVIETDGEEQWVDQISRMVVS
jgi:hypothetical protein